MPRFGYIAVIGRPNVGKSTLTNRLVGAKVSITSRKPQTTRHRIHGIITKGDAQFVLVDTPGFQNEHRTALTRAMDRNIRGALEGVDAVLFVTEAGRWTQDEQGLLDRLSGRAIPVLVAVNKVDRLPNRDAALPLIQELSARYDFCAIVPISAEKGWGLENLLQALREQLPEREFEFSEDDFTDRSERFHASEILREKLFRNLGDELPYALAVEIERFEVDGATRRINAAILVERAAHKAIVIGTRGERLKRIASDARKEMEAMFGGPVWLETWVKVRGGWADDERLVRGLGYEDGV